MCPEAVIPWSRRLPRHFALCDKMPEGHIILRHHLLNLASYLVSSASDALPGDHL